MSDQQGDSSLDVLYAERFDRGRLLRRAAAAGATLSLAPWVATSVARAASRTIKIGYVSPLTGPLAPFGAADKFTIGRMKAVFAKGLKVGTNTFPIEILQRDAQSNSNRAATVAQSLILDDDVDLILVGDTPDIVNPVADTCEANQVPCISSLAPWQPYFFGRKGDPKKGFKWTYHFFWGLEDVIAVFLDMWSQIPTNKTVGGIFPNDPDGNAWGDKKLGFPPPLKTAGYTIVDPGRFPDGNDDFSSQIAKFKARKAADRHRRSDPPGLHDLLDPGAAAGLPAEDRLRRQGAALPVFGRGAGQEWRRHVDRALVEPVSPVQVVADGTVGGRARSPSARRRPTVSGPSRSASPMRCSRSRPTCSGAPRTSTTRRRSSTRSRRRT